MVWNKRANLILLLAIDWLVQRCAGQVNGGVENKGEHKSNLTTNVTLSFSTEQTSISGGHILLSSTSPSNRVATKIDSRSLINQATANSFKNNSNKLPTFAHYSQPNATNSPSYRATKQAANKTTNYFISTNHQWPNQIDDKKFIKRTKQFSRTRRRSVSEQLDERVFSLHNEQRSINMANNVKMYEMVMKRRRSSDGVESITLGAILPKTALITKFRSYQKRLQDAVEDLMDAKNGVFHFTHRFRIAQAQLVLLSRSPSPTEILSALCDKLLPYNVSTLIYMSNSDTDDNDAASALYLMQLTSYLGIPVISWNPDNIGLEQRVPNSLMLQLAPSVSHIAHGMLSLLRRYSWHSFSVLSTDSTGHEHFVRSLRDQMLTIHDYKYTILDVFVFKTRSREDVKNELRELTKSESRVYLLYCSKNHAKTILEEAAAFELTKKNYVWIVSESIVGSDISTQAPLSFPPGMLGVHFNTTHERLLDEIERAVNIYGHGLESFASNQQHSHRSLSPDLRCNETTDRRWLVGEILYKHLRGISIQNAKSGKPNLEFNQDGTLKYVELNIMNLNAAHLWEKIGVWDKDGLDIKDITWPENSPIPPPGVPEKFSLKVTFLEEPPFLNSMNPNNITGECKTSRSVRCRYAPLSDLKNINKEDAYKNSSYYRCCSGFCIDLLQKFSQDLKFSFELYRVEDSNWGILSQNGSWNGLIQELLEHKADMVVTSIKINSERQAYVDFTVPFLETGITIVVAKRTGIISPKAFLEPFDTVCWVMILLISCQVAAFAIFIFEWLSPSGYNMSMKASKGHSFSLFRTYWLVFAILFGAAVPVNCPRGYTARFMSNVWATFAVVFLAIYTANLAAFMITREDFYDFSGIDDSRLANPTQRVPPLRFATIPHGNTEAVLKRNKPRMHAYMKQFNTSRSSDGVRQVRNGNLDAFIYDAVVLDYMAGQDPDCRLLTVGSWYAMTGYGFAFPKNSKYLAKFNEKMIEYRENGDLERLRKFWFQGACKTNNKDKGNLEGKLSNPLDVNQFMSAFLLLGCGILLTIILLLAEHFYFRYCRKHLIGKERDPCFTLISLSMAKSLNTANGYPVGQEEDNLLIETGQEEKVKIELKKRSNVREECVKRTTKQPDESTTQITQNNPNQSQLNKTQSNQVKPQPEYYAPMDKMNKSNRLKLRRLQYLNACACNNCELCNKQTRSIQQLQRELEMARCELRSLRHHLLLSNSSKQPLNCLADDDEFIKPIPPPQRYLSCSMPNTPKHRDGCYDQHCQDCYFVDLYQPSHSINNLTSPCGLEHLLPNVNSYSGCCLDELSQYADQAYEQKKIYESNYTSNAQSELDTMRNRKGTSTKLESNEANATSRLTGVDEGYNPNLIASKTPNQATNQEKQRLTKSRASLVAMQTFTLNPDDEDDYSLEMNKNMQMDAKNNNFYNEGVCSSNVKTQTKTQNINPLFNRSKTSKSLTRSLSRDQQYGSLNYDKTESFDEIKFHQKSREQQELVTKKSSALDTNYETTC